MRPLTRRPEEWLDRRGQVLMTWSLFNPYGPTLWCLGVEETPRGRDLFCRCVHPLLDTTLVLGTLPVGTMIDRTFWRLLGRGFAGQGVPEAHPLLTAIPSLVTIPNAPEFAERVPGVMVRSPALRRADWGREIYYLTKYGPELFDRAMEEFREATSRLGAAPRQQMDWRQAVADAREDYRDTVTGADDLFNYTPAPFTEGRRAQWWTVMRSERFMSHAVPLLASAWVGAWHQSRDRNRLLPFEAVRDFLAAYGHPLWPVSTTTRVPPPTRTGDPRSGPAGQAESGRTPV